MDEETPWRSDGKMGRYERELILPSWSSDSASQVHQRRRVGGYKVSGDLPPNWVENNSLSSSQRKYGALLLALLLLGPGHCIIPRT